jgi:glycosyltransferase involved in cell wall biosynthesis
LKEFDVVQIARGIGLRGGSECVAYELHRAWRKLGVNAQAVTSVATENDGREGLILLAVWLADLYDWGYLTLALALPLFTIAATVHAKRKYRSSIVVSHGDSLFGDVCIVHAVNRASNIAKRNAGEYRWLLNPANIWIAWRDWFMFRGNRYRRIIAISERVRQQLKDLYGVPDERIVTIPNGINLTRYTPNRTKTNSQVRRELGVAEDVPLILFVGSQFRLKGLEFVIRSLPKLKTDVQLLVVGNDSPTAFRSLAKELGVADRVHFAGPRKDLPDIYPAADIFVFPSLYETFALVCVEAMASGVPVLATRVGGIEDYLCDEENGLFIEREASDIAEKIDRVLGDPNLRERLITNGLATATNYSWDTIAQQYLRLFDQLMQEREVTAKVDISEPSAISA